MIYIDNRTWTPPEDPETDEQFESYQEYTEWLEDGYSDDWEEYL